MQWITLACQPRYGTKGIGHACVKIILWRSVVATVNVDVLGRGSTSQQRVKYSKMNNLCLLYVVDVGEWTQ
jgi:hypothetical protein